MALLMSLILGSGLAAFTSSNSASAQNYGYQNDYYGSDGSSSHKGGGEKDNSYPSKYPTEDKRYECRTCSFEGFFVSWVEFCNVKHNKFEDKKGGYIINNFYQFGIDKIVDSFFCEFILYLNR